MTRDEVNERILELHLDAGIATTDKLISLQKLASMTSAQILLPEIEILMLYLGVNDRANALLVAQSLYARREYLIIDEVRPLMWAFSYALQMHQEAITLQEDVLTTDRLARIWNEFSCARAIANASVHSKQALKKSIDPLLLKITTKDAVDE